MYDYMDYYNQFIAEFFAETAGFQIDEFTEPVRLICPFFSMGVSFNLPSVVKD